MDKLCSHLTSVAKGRDRPVHPTGHGCEECLATGGHWVHLRLCLACGHVGCCDESPGRHATAHFHSTQHPVIKSFEPGENWAWCYPDQAGLDVIPAFREEAPIRHYEAPWEKPRKGFEGGV